MTGSTSGVERSFFLASWAVEGRRGPAFESLENDEMQIVCYEDLYGEVDAILDLAREAWVKAGYGKARVPYNTRLDSGTKRAAAPGNSESAWLKRRRAEVDSLMQDVGAVAAEQAVHDIKTCRRGWTRRHAKFAKSLLHKRMSRFVDAVLNGGIDPKSLGEDECDVIMQEIKRREQVDKRYVATVRRRQSVFEPRAPPALDQKRVFVEPNVDICEPRLRSAMRASGMERVADRLQADIFVVRNPAQVGQRTAWCCGMLGGMITTSEFILSGGRRGAAVAYSPGYRFRRTVFCTDRFRDSHPTVFEILQDTSRRRGHKWRWLQSLEDVTSMSQQYKRTGRLAELIVLACTEEVKHPGEATLRNKETNTEGARQSGTGPIRSETPTHVPCEPRVGQHVLDISC